MQYYMIILLVFIAVYFTLQHRRLAVNLHRIRKKRGKREMTDLIQKYIGKECLIYTCMSSSSQMSGIVRSCKDGWLEVETNGQTDIVNCEYIIRIREYPKNKKGKRKSVVID